MGLQANGFIGLSFKMGLSSQGLGSSENFQKRCSNNPLSNQSRGKNSMPQTVSAALESSLLGMNQACWASCKPYVGFYYLRVLESRFRNVTSRPELIPSVTLPREEGEKNHRLEMGQTPTFWAFVRGQERSSGPTVGMNKATKKHKRSMWYWHLQNKS